MNEYPMSSVVGGRENTTQKEGRRRHVAIFTYERAFENSLQPSRMSRPAPTQKFIHKSRQWRHFPLEQYSDFTNALYVKTK